MVLTVLPLAPEFTISCRLFSGNGLIKPEKKVLHVSKILPYNMSQKLLYKMGHYFMGIQ